MAAIEELINTIITFAFVLLPLWILMSRRRRMQQERRQRSDTPPGQPPPDRQPRVPQRPQQMPETSGDDYRDRTVADQSYSSEQRERTSPRKVADTPRSKEPGRLEKMLRDILGAGEPQVDPAAERERQLALARQRAEAARKKRRKSSADRPVVEVPRHADVKIHAVMPESGSLSLSPGGMGSQQMRTAAGNLGASSSAEKTPPAAGSLGEGWRRANRLPDFKRALILSELLGKPHALKDDT
ncbi:MAG: hypothetical protein EA404_06700 [Spirochaetaceae bacterium]|nr:MAG: hypothetical protein EA404_06700 [Spirochaetaceae bacterium]